MNWLLQDLRYALRQLRKSPGFTAAAVITLALAIGANTAIFSILDPLLIRKLPVQNPDELVWVTSTGRLGPAEPSASELQSFYTYRDKAQVFSGVLAFTPAAQYEISRNGQTAPAQGEIVSGNYFTVLGVQPYKGRLFTAAEDRASSGTPTVVLSFEYWKRAFDADPAIIGRVLPLNHLLYTVVGVTPPGFFGTEVGKSPDFYLPLGSHLSPEEQSRAHWVTIIARLKPGVSRTQAEAGLEPLFQQITQASSIPEVELREFFERLVLIPATRGLSEFRAQFSLPARVLMAVVGLVLLIACTNVASLLLARGTGRRKEINVRLALGSGRRRLIRQFLVESMVLVAIGTACGLLFGKWVSGLLVAALSSEHSAIVLASGVTGDVLLFAVAVMSITVLLCGLVPAFSMTRSDLVGELNVQTPEPTRRSRSEIGRLLVVGQVALSVVLLAGASLLLHSLINLETFDPGFNRDHVLVASINKPPAGLSAAQIQVLYSHLLDRIKSLPDVRSASYSSFTPISGREIGINVAVEGHPLPSNENANVRFVGVSPAYFETLGIPLLAGRAFTPQDNRQPPRVAILNRTMAQRFFGNENPLGKRFSLVEGNRPPLEIIGVVADSKYNNLREKTLEFFYLPSGAGSALEVRVGGDPKMLAGSVRTLIQSVDSSVSVASIKTLREQVTESLQQDHLIVALCWAFSLLALTLTSVGLYSILGFSVSRRTHEIGIRMALGACRQDIFRLVVGEGMFLTIAGLFIGAAGAIASVSLFKSLLFGVKPIDPAALVAVLLLLAAAAFTACYIPARRAAKVDPMVALRYE
ncbi:MAG: ABC transporter permease [Terriglobales bacterium]